jgi:hypothetical protein
MYGLKTVPFREASLSAVMYGLKAVHTGMALGQPRLAFPRGIPGLKSETWGTLRVSSDESFWAAQGWGFEGGAN